MNKLRELIDAIEKDGSSPLISKISDVSYWLSINKESIADLIDAAEALSWTLPKDHRLIVAWEKLEEPK